jgi:hypothetical protein
MTLSMSPHPLILNDSTPSLSSKKKNANGDLEDSDDDHDNDKRIRPASKTDSMAITTDDQQSDRCGGEDDDYDMPVKDYNRCHALPQELSGTSSTSSSTELKYPHNNITGGTMISSSSSRKRTLAEVSINNNSSWQEFCNKGSLFKTLLDGAVEKVTTAVAASATTVIGSASSSYQGLGTVFGNDDDDNKENSTTDSEDAHVRHSNNSGNTSSSRLVERLLRQKTTECLLSQQKLEQQQSQLVALQAMVDDLRETKKNLVIQTSTLTGAFKQARQNAKQARQERVCVCIYVCVSRQCVYVILSKNKDVRPYTQTLHFVCFLYVLSNGNPPPLYGINHREDADAAETTAATLAAKLEALEIVVLETKRASQLLLEEQDQVTNGAQVIESKFIEAQANVVRAKAAKDKLEREISSLISKRQEIDNHLQRLSQELQQERMEKQQWKRRCQELELTKKSQHERLNRLEDELQISQSLLVDATTAMNETKRAKNDVEVDMERLQKANQELHKQSQELRQLRRQEKDSHQQALVQLEQNQQAAQVEGNSQREKIQNLKLEKQIADKSIAQLQSKAANMERRLQELTNLSSITTSTNVCISADRVTTGDDDGRDLLVTTPSHSDHGSETLATNTFVIPPLEGNNENNPAGIVTKCSLCFKDFSGLMKKCDCGRPDCKLRAHQMCVHRIHSTAAAGKTSVSHPGTPAPKLPVILCSSTIQSLIDSSRRRHTISSSGARRSSGANNRTIQQEPLTTAISPIGVSTPTQQQHLDA